MKNATQTSSKYVLIMRCLEAIKARPRTVKELSELEGMTKSRACIYADELQANLHVTATYGEKRRGKPARTLVFLSEYKRKVFEVVNVEYTEFSDNPFRNSIFNVTTPKLTAHGKVHEGFKVHTHLPRKHGAVGVQWTGNCSLGSF